MPDNIQPPAEGNNIEQLLSQLSPEELEQLATALSADMQNPAAHEGGESVSGLAQAIESHLGQSPEAEVPEAAPEKVAALNFVKSASYIEGFLNHALDNGVAVKQAVDLYDQALSSTISNLRKEAAESKAEEKKESKKHEKSETIKQEKKEHEDMEQEKMAAYYEGVFSRAREYGFSDRQTANLLKAAAEPNTPFDDQFTKTMVEGPYKNSLQGKLMQDMAERTGANAPDARSGINTDGLQYMHSNPLARSTIEGGELMGDRSGMELNDQPPMPGASEKMQMLLAKLKGQAGDFGGQLSEMAHKGMDQASALGHQGMDYIGEHPAQAAIAALLAGGGAYGARKLMHRDDGKAQKTAAAVNFLRATLSR